MKTWERAISEGRFREDLFHRLNEFTINVPPLSECGEDILPLAEFFMRHFSEKHRKPIRGFNSLAAVSLQKYPWPGNIRELKNCIQRAVLLSADGWISLEGLNLDLTVGREETASLSEEEKEKRLLLKTLEEARATVPSTGQDARYQPDLLVREIKKIPDYMSGQHSSKMRK